MNWWRDNLYFCMLDVIMNLSFIYNLINGGVDEGSNFWDVMIFIFIVGVVLFDVFLFYIYFLKEVFINGIFINYIFYYEWYNEVIFRWFNIIQWMIVLCNSGNDYMWQVLLYEY